MVVHNRLEFAYSLGFHEAEAESDSLQVITFVESDSVQVINFCNG